MRSAFYSSAPVSREKDTPSRVCWIFLVVTNMPWVHHVRKSQSLKHETESTFISTSTIRNSIWKQMDIKIHNYPMKVNIRVGRRYYATPLILTQKIFLCVTQTKCTEIDNLLWGKQIASWFIMYFPSDMHTPTPWLSNLLFLFFSAN